MDALNRSGQGRDMGTISQIRSRRWRILGSRIRPLWTSVFLMLVAPALGADRNLTFPGAEWEPATPESRGFSSPKLEVLRRWLQTQQTTAIHVSVQGRVVFEYGDVKRVSKVASVRKSILAMLYGNYIRTNPAALDRTVVDLGLEDVTPFLPIETSATLYHLLTARSGVYLPTANRELTDLMPRRGSQAPGTYFQYQNWDFNAAGTAFETISRKEIFQALEEDLAKPLGMQDFDRALQRKNDERPVTRHPEYAMYLSTRDMARIGLLMLAGGRWNGTALMPDGWSYRITRLVTPQNELHPLGVGAHATQVGRWGYGMLWWVWDAPNIPGTQTGPYQGAYSAMGANGQYITVIPAMNLVVAHKVDFDTDGTRRVSSDEYQTLLQLLINSSL